VFRKIFSSIELLFELFSPPDLVHEEGFLASSIFRNRFDKCITNYKAFFNLVKKKISLFIFNLSAKQKWLSTAILFKIQFLSSLSIHELSTG